MASHSGTSISRISSPPWRQRSRPSVSGGVMLSLVTERRSDPPSFWQPRQTSVSSPESDIPCTTPVPDGVPQWEISTDEAASWGYTHPAPSSPTPIAAASNTIGAAPLKCDTGPLPGSGERVQEPGPGARRSRLQNSIPPSPPSADQSTSHTASTPRSTTTPPRTNALNVKALTFVPGQLPIANVAEQSDVPAAMGDIDLNEYIKQSTAKCPSPRPSLLPCKTPPSTEGSRTPSAEEDMANQWLDQTVFPVANPRYEINFHHGAEVSKLTPSLDIRSDDIHAVTGTARPRGGKAEHDNPRGAGTCLPTRSPPVSVAVSAVSPFGVALAHARNFEDFGSVSYPKSIKRPDPALKQGILQYDRDFLLQFEDVCTARPASLPSVDAVWLHVLAPSREHEGSSARSTEVGTSWRDRSSPGEDYSRASEPTSSQSAQRRKCAPGAPASPSDEGILSYISSTPTVVGAPPVRSSSEDRGSSKLEIPIDERIRGARLDRLEAKVVSLYSEIEVLRFEIARLRRSSP